MSLTAGQKLFYVPTRRPENAHEVTITKVGRKWAQVLELRYRIDVNTLAVDGGQWISPGQCYYSRELYEEHLELRRAWDELIALMRNWYGPPPAHLGLRGIRQMLAMLGSANP